MLYKNTVLGGTFDLLHAGHISLIESAFNQSDFVNIGLTTDAFNKKTEKKTYENQSLRKKHLESFLVKNGFANRYKIVLINDIYSIAATDPEIEAIFVTSDTKHNADLINKKRAKIGIKKLTIIILPFVKDEEGLIIASSRVRNGEINVKGESYKKKLLKLADIKLSEEIRSKLKTPFGKIIKTPGSSPLSFWGSRLVGRHQNHSFRGFWPPARNASQIEAGGSQNDDSKTSPNIITVGDITTQKILKTGIIPQLSIVDFKVQRVPVYNSLQDLGFKKNQAHTITTNTAGAISKELILVVEKALTNPPVILVIPPRREQPGSIRDSGPFQNAQGRQSARMTPSKQTYVILVSGEEDLAVIPCILLSPLETLVLYGQPDKGMVEIEVTLEIKNSLCTLLKI